MKSGGAADREAVHHRDHRLGNPAQRAVESGHVETDAGAVPISVDVAPGLVAAGAEGVVRAREDGDGDGAIAPCGVKGRDEFVHGLGSEGVFHLRALDRDPGGRLGDAVGDVGVGHGRIWHAGGGLC